MLGITAPVEFRVLFHPVFFQHKKQIEILNTTNFRTVAFELRISFHPFLLLLLLLLLLFFSRLSIALQHTSRPIRKQTELLNSIRRNTRIRSLLTSHLLMLRGGRAIRFSSIRNFILILYFSAQDSSDPPLLNIVFSPISSPPRVQASPRITIAAKHKVDPSLQYSRSFQTPPFFIFLPFYSCYLFKY